MDTNQLQDQLNVLPSDMKRLPSNLNTLTILTYIGCAIAFLSGIYNYFTVCGKIAELEKAAETLGGSGIVADMMAKTLEMTNKTCENKLIILIATLVCTALCFYGAMQMRNLKKIGFPIYTVGEILLPIITAVLLGSGSMSGLFAIAGLLVPIVFVILYASQRKYLAD
jgi:ABC-type antimicrobial peptide transport system permease subunit